jgi:hypothetical protein
MTLNVIAIINSVVSYASSSGYFDNVQSHEPKSMPGTGLMFAVFLDDDAVTPIGEASGLASTTVRIELTGRIYKPFLSAVEDLIDPNLAEATDALMTALSGDFDLGSNARNVDLLGAHGTPLQARAGYQTIDRTVYRVIDITIPVIVNDAWTQTA